MTLNYLLSSKILTSDILHIIFTYQWTVRSCELEPVVNSNVTNSLKLHAGQSMSVMCAKGYQTSTGHTYFTVNCILCQEINRTCLLNVTVCEGNTVQNLLVSIYNFFQYRLYNAYI